MFQSILSYSGLFSKHKFSQEGKNLNFKELKFQSLQNFEVYYCIVGYEIFTGEGKFKFQRIKISKFTEF